MYLRICGFLGPWGGEKFFSLREPAEADRCSVVYGSAWGLQEALWR